MERIGLTVGNEINVGSIDLGEQIGIVRGPFGEFLGFYNYKKDYTTNNKGTFYMKGNKTIDLILEYAEQLRQNGIDVKLYGK